MSGGCGRPSLKLRLPSTAQAASYARGHGVYRMSFVKVDH